MICIDEPQWRKGYGRVSHLFSDKPGLEGEVELLEFGSKLGLHRSWLQDKRPAHVHFDVMNSIIERALAAGANVVDYAQMREIYYKKKQQLEQAQEQKRKNGVLTKEQEVEYVDGQD